MNFTLTRVHRRHGETVLDFLLRSPHIRRCVQELKFGAPAGEFAWHHAEEKKMQELLPLLTSLRKIEYYLHVLLTSNY